MNSFGNKLRLTTFGESHGKAIGGVIDGFPSGFKIDFESLYEEVAKRSPGSSPLVTQRKETDMPEFLSGISEDGITLGTSIGFIIKNADNRGKDYSEIADKYRPNHADFTYDMRYGLREFRGGGRASARETANWVVAGALAQQWLNSKGIQISAELTGAGSVDYTGPLSMLLSQEPSRNNKIVVPEEIRKGIEEEILSAKNEGDSIGGKVSCLITGLPAGIGEPVGDKLHARLAYAMMSINAAKGFEYGLGMASALHRGSEIIDIFESNEGVVKATTNYSGGIQGGISNGMPIFFNIAFKPTPTIMKELPTITESGEKTLLKMKGRHDPCVAVRAVAVVKAMAALVVADYMI